MPGERGEGAATAAPALRRQLFLILALRCLRTASFAQPVLVVWFAAVGVSPAGVLWLSSAYSALVNLATVPSGVISDGLGRRRTLLWAFVALSGSFGAAALADRALWLLGASLVLKAVGAALFSGTDMALLYETIKRYKQASEVKEEAVAVESIHIFAVAVTEALFATIGGVMADRCGLQVRQHPSAGVSPTIIHRFWSSRRRWGSLSCRSRPVRGSRCCSRMTRWLPAPTPAHQPLAGGGLATALGCPRPALVACSRAVWCEPMPVLCCPFPCSSTSGSAPGGQGVNTTDSAVQIQHKPTGMIVRCMDSRAQQKNKEQAMKVLRSRLLEIKIAEEHAKYAAERKAQVGNGERNERSRTYNFSQNRVTDHRIDLTLYNLPTFIEGEIEEVVSALLANDLKERLAALE